MTMNALTLAQLSAAKHLPAEFLVGLGLHDTQRGVSIPYRDTVERAERVMFERIRVALNGRKRFLQPAGIPLAPYGLDRLEHARAEKYLVLPEGESDSWTLWFHNFPALGLPGASTAKTLESEYLARISRLFIFREPGEAGAGFVDKLAARLHELDFTGEAFEISLDGWKDPSELHCEYPGDFRTRFQATLDHATVLNLAVPDKKRTALEFVTLSTVRSERLQFLWPGHIPAGKLTEAIGDPGFGKTLVAIDIGARVSTGSPFADGASGCEPADVLFASGEDDVRDTLRPRAEAAGANLTRIHVLATPLLLPDDIAALKAEIDKHAAKLVILDPLDSFLAKGIDSNKSSDVRGALSKLKDLAASTGTAIVIVRHLNKDSKITNALYRGGGSIGYTAASRASFLIAPNPSDPDARVFAPVKCNLTLKPRALKFRTLKYSLADGIDTQKIEWLGPIDISANDLLQAQASGPRGPRPDKTEAAKELVRVALADGEQHASRPIIEDAKQQGISFGTLSSAAKSLGVKRHKGGFEGGWAWSLSQTPSSNASAEPPKATEASSRNGYHHLHTRPKANQLSPDSGQLALWAADSDALRSDRLAATGCEPEEREF